MNHFRPAERRLARKRGVATLEFALTTPFIMLLMLASTDLTIFMRTKARLEQTATELALVVTQYTKLYDGDFTGLFNAAQTLANSTPVTGLSGTTIITGIVTDNNDHQTIAWQKRSSLATAASRFGTAAGSTPTLPNGYLMPKNSTLIAVEVFTTTSPWVLSTSLMGGAGTPTSLRSYALFESRLGSLSTVIAGSRP